MSLDLSNTLEIISRCQGQIDGGRNGSYLESERIPGHKIVENKNNIGVSQ